MKNNNRNKLFRVYQVKNGVVDYFEDAHIYDSYGISSFLIRYNEHNDTKFYSIPQFNEKNKSYLKIQMIE